MLSTSTTPRLTNVIQQARRIKLIASSCRQVSVSSPSQANQLAHKQQQQHEQDSDAHELENCEFTASEPVQAARRTHLGLWYSLDKLKRHGHRLSRLDPLNLHQPESLDSITWDSELVERLRNCNEPVQKLGFLAPATHDSLNGPGSGSIKVNELYEQVSQIYVNNQSALEYSHMTRSDEVEWLCHEWESINSVVSNEPKQALTAIDQLHYARLLLECEHFDHYLAAKFPTTKRYGCEGAESMLVVFDEIFRLCHATSSKRVKYKELGPLSTLEQPLDHVIIGMAHRGRLNLLACLLELPPEVIFAKCKGEPELDLREAWMASGDVLSHLSTNLRFNYGLRRQHIGLSRDSPEPINVSLLPNPSHLELSSPMVMGAARGRAHNIYHNYSSSPKFLAQNQPLPDQAEQQPLPGSLCGQYNHHLNSILPVQVHGDASLAGQGVIQETLQMANLGHYTVGGSLHLVLNNQIGYTTPSNMGKSSRYCTDIFKLIEAPILHVNAANIPSVLKATRLAMAYRQKFHKDVAIDLVCFRKHGHNEMDEPSFTQPVMYREIRERSSIPSDFCDQIEMVEKDREACLNDFKLKLQSAFKQTQSFRPDNDNYRNFSLPTEYHRDSLIRWQTGCDMGLLKRVALQSIRTPESFNVHPKLAKTLVEDRKSRFDNELNIAGSPIDWATAEIMAFGSLLAQNQSVRLAGQDVARGTFSTRHAVLFDHVDERPYVPLNALIEFEAEPALPVASEQQQPQTSNLAKLEVVNSILSEEAALAYEFAYSQETCSLTIWEAQFGDFFNTAQSVIDTLVSSSESKWLRQSPLTLLLPHGLDGAGPEHSSSRLERFLQLSSSSVDSVDTEAKCNWSVCYPTLPSQYFHLLRRQVLRPFRKPLVVMSPKMLFRHPMCVSPLGAFGPQASFEPLLDDPTVCSGGRSHVEVAHERVDTIALCTGKLYFQLAELKASGSMDNVAIVRLEELCPFPAHQLAQVIGKYPRVSPERLFWVQEEHENQGAFNFVEQRARKLMNLRLNYIGRPVSQLTAVGSSSLHKRELELVLKSFESLKSTTTTTTASC